MHSYTFSVGVHHQGTRRTACRCASQCEHTYRLKIASVSMQIDRVGLCASLRQSEILIGILFDASQHKLFLACLY